MEIFPFESIAAVTLFPNSVSICDKNSPTVSLVALEMVCVPVKLAPPRVVPEYVIVLPSVILLASPPVFICDHVVADEI